ncbi:MAG: adenylosuccinate lyase [Cyanobacteria bacterium NC_groundwater_1444_Ag_S-0.65um_54_12]|nr:adenylosuccinate lyase [Cyanobacteria bacterium NC_groundwater_1444_Ag_S-0.65um_54_12]
MASAAKNIDFDEKSREISALQAISPIDGRYSALTRPICDYFSEYALIYHRLEVEIEYFLALLAEIGISLNDNEIDFVRGIKRQGNLQIALKVKQQEASTAHDVKALEYVLKEHVAGSSLAVHVEKIHLGLTSEDINNLAYSLMQQRALRSVIWPALHQLLLGLSGLVKAERATPMLARTHGQPATPTTLGKELGVFLYRLTSECHELLQQRFRGKLSGATGTYAALQVSYPTHDWCNFAKKFVEQLGLTHNPITTQIEPHDGFAALCDCLRHLSNILLNFCQDIWWYISLGYFRQVARSGEVGSSTMPHKVNPIDFENAEGNLGIASALLTHFSDKLTRSRLQRDLSDSTVLRNVGVAFAHLLVAIRGLERGLRKLEVDRKALESDLSAHPEVLAEAYQTVLRASGSQAPYERLLALTRGRQVSLAELRSWVRSLDLTVDKETLLLELTPDRYVGLAAEMADVALAAANSLLVRHGGTQ